MMNIKKEGVSILLFIIAVISSLLLALCTSIQPIYLKKVVDSASVLDGDYTLYFFLFYILSIVGILIFETIRKLSIDKYKINKTREIKKKLLSSIINKSIKSFQKEKKQNYLTILNQEIDMLIENYYVEKLELTYSFLVFVGSVISLIYINYIVAILIFIFTILPIILSTILGYKIKYKTNVYTKALELFNIKISSFIHAFSMIRINSAESDCENILEIDNEKVAEENFNKSKTLIFVQMLSGSLSYIGEIVLVGVSIYMIFKGNLTIGALLASLQLSEMLAIPTNSISYQINNMNSVKGIKEKIALLLKEKENQEKYSCPVINSVELKNVSFSYDDNIVLNNIDLRFEKGKKYLIVGENGSGKSTLFKIISKFDDRYEGDIYINNINIKEINDSLYNQMGIILQNTHMISDSLMNNITLYKNYSIEYINKILVSLGMEEFVKKHHFNEEYHDAKDNLSGGEKQKIDIARVLLQKKNFILMDEGTSAIDLKSSMDIEKRLLTDKDITLIHIEHKIIPELVDLYDCILEIKDGKIYRKETMI